MKKPVAPATVRCAIYTRKSTEEGLDQAFNSLDAQREACEAYVCSQAGEGWQILPTAYDDGGFSGGTLDRPALRRLLADVDAGRIDTIVVYKIDRLTRSLMDFAKIVERLDAASASFVSVTQSFNTTTSMGRLTLNVLLSFAQFEREVTGERIRDKIAASKAKGMWMGGNLPLGYDAPTDPTTRALVVHEAEAELVRHIFRTYLEEGSVHALQRRLQNEGAKPKQYVSRHGRKRGAELFGRGALFHLLKNRVYRGEITHRDVSHPGRHPAILDVALFDAVQQRLASQTREHKTRPLRSAEALLKGKIFDTDGRPMTPAFSQGKSGTPYRYYVTTDLQRGGRRSGESGAIQRVSAPALEEFIHGLVRRVGGRSQMSWPEAAGLVLRLDIRPQSLELDLDRAELGLTVHEIEGRLLTGEKAGLGPSGMHIHAPIRIRMRGGRNWILSADGKAASTGTQASKVLIRGLKAAHRVARNASLDPEGKLAAATQASSPSNAHERKLAMLVFLAPDIQRSIVEGRQPRDVNLEQLMSEDLPLLWSDQRASLGI